ncbi:hypothetical protein RchiOBHm_Chr2g0160941 [Rosa chinensis]|uniref:Uncharacterized protein n=1 Tax=Rosa chinensis TaxID=74649 RepID=A0A2P6S2M4_ROSCH|nr:hypothetical protein RchiOBHm_Chr2g0160941 [Rosa chinensis]
MGLAFARWTANELRMKPCYVVFVGLSAGIKACMYKVFQLILFPAILTASFQAVSVSVSSYVFPSLKFSLSQLHLFSHNLNCISLKETIHCMIFDYKKEKKGKTT